MSSLTIVPAKASIAATGSSTQEAYAQVSAELELWSGSIYGSPSIEASFEPFEGGLEGTLGCMAFMSAAFELLDGELLTGAQVESSLENWAGELQGRVDAVASIQGSFEFLVADFEVTASTIGAIKSSFSLWSADISASSQLVTVKAEFKPFGAELSVLAGSFCEISAEAALWTADLQGTDSEVAQVVGNFMPWYGSLKGPSSESIVQFRRPYDYLSN